jgi:hypothetical protein
MQSIRFPTLIMFLIVAGSRGAPAQTFPTDNPVIKRMWDEGMTTRSQAASLAQVLMDSIGPRLYGSPALESANEWVQSKYREWGVTVRQERIGTWAGWKRGYTHLDLVAPRIRTLDGIMLAWSKGTDGPVEGEVILPPDLPNEAAFDAWLPNAKGKFILASPPEPTCRPAENLASLARPATIAALEKERSDLRRAFSIRLARLGRNGQQKVIEAGALGILTTLWSEGWGVNKIFEASNDAIPELDVSCEDYGLLFRLASNNQGPRIRLDARSEALGQVPTFNVIAEMRGSEKPNEYVVLGAHLDSWDGASGATDNGTGSITMLEAARILKTAYPNPKRTIIIGHWGGEERGLIGSRAFAEDHPEVVEGLQTALNQDNGTWRVEYIRMMGLTGAGAFFGRWLAQLPSEIEGEIDLDLPGVPETGGSDHMAFLCHGAPSFRLQSNYPDYRQYTWHTNRDTYDKVILDDLRNNATLAAMLAYLASEDPERVPRDKRVMPPGADGRPGTWPACQPARRSGG